MDDIRIIDFINDRMSEVESQAFELELKQNSALAERYAYLKNVAAAAEINSIRGSIYKAEKELEKENFFAPASAAITDDVSTSKKSSTSYKFIFTAIAAAITLLLILGLFRINKNCSDKAIAQSSMKGEQLVNTTTRGAGAIGGYDRAIKYFYDGNFEKAANQLTSIPASDPSYSDGQYALALIEFKNGNYRKSIEIIQPLLTMNKDLKDKSGWLHLNALICENGYSDKLVNQFIGTNPEDFYQKKAQNLLKMAKHPFRSLVF